MNNDIHKGEILTTWKEIATYLKCGVRTCFRWEAEEGLPIHRQEGAPKSRIYAYKHELDAWFKARLGNGKFVSEIRINKGFFQRYQILIAAIVIVLAGGGIFLLSRKDRKARDNQPASIVPQSTSGFGLHPADIVESEFGAEGVMRVWREKSKGSYFEAWRIEPVRHTSFAIGNIDDNPNLEVVAPGHCRELYESEGRTGTYIRFFLNAYKYDHKDWWKTTFYNPEQCVFEKDNYEFTEIAIGNVDGLAGNEIVLATAHALSVFKYDSESEEIHRVTRRSFSRETKSPLLRSLRLADIDADGKTEMLVTANEGEEGDVTENRSWLSILAMEDGKIEVRKVLTLTGTTSVHSLRIGDVIPGGGLEAVFPYYKKENDSWRVSILGWNWLDGSVFEELVEEMASTLTPSIYLDVGDLTATSAGDEIIVAKNRTNELVCYSWDETKLKSGPKYALDHRIRINGVQVGGREQDPQKQASVLVYGSSQLEDMIGQFYLERVSFTDGFFPGWRRWGGDKGELPISFAGFAFIHQE